jgi:hypothetical protein
MLLKKTKNLACLQIRLDEDVFIKIRETRRSLIPYLRDAKRFGLRAFWRKDKLDMGRLVMMG